MLRPDLPLISGLSTLAPRYGAVLCDVWGVLHNGVAAFQGAVEALVQYRRAGGHVVLLTNAPRPYLSVVAQITALGVPVEAYDAVVTSGDVTRSLLASRLERAIVHIGPPRDLTLIEGLPGRLASDAEGEIIVATGLYDDDREAPENYRGRFEPLIERGLPFVCANPDIVVERGHSLVYCAGALAQLYAAMGGEVVMVGKPFAPIYKAALARIDDVAGRPVDIRSVLAIGDGLPTDITGAAHNGLDVLFVTGGIHAADFGPTDAPDIAEVSTRLNKEGLNSVAAIAKLVW